MSYFKGLILPQIVHKLAALKNRALRWAFIIKIKITLKLSERLISKVILPLLAYEKFEA